MFASERLRGVAPLNDAIAAFAATSPAARLVTRYNTAVRHYEHERESTLQRPGRPTLRLRDPTGVRARELMGAAPAIGLDGRNTDR